MQLYQFPIRAQYRREPLRHLHGESIQSEQGRRCFDYTSARRDETRQVSSHTIAKEEPPNSEEEPTVSRGLGETSENSGTERAKTQVSQGPGVLSPLSFTYEKWITLRYHPSGKFRGASFSVKTSGALRHSKMVMRNPDTSITDPTTWSAMRLALPVERSQSDISSSWQANQNW